MKKVAIVVGHTKLRPGACGVNGLPCEWAFNKEVAGYLQDIADIYYYDSYNMGYKSMVRRNSEKMNAQDYDLILELHYNAETPQANGCEVFHYFTNKQGKEYAKKLSALISQNFNIKDRGAKAMVKKSQRGYWALFYPKKTTLLLEPFFGSNPSDAAKFCGEEEQYAKVIRTFLESSNII